MKTIYLVQQESYIVENHYYEQPTPLFTVETKEQAMREVKKLNDEQLKKDTTNDYCIFSYSWCPLMYFEKDTQS